MDTSDVDVEITTSSNERTRLIPKVSCRRVLYATLISVWGTLSFGYCLGYSSPASYDLHSVANPAIRLSGSQQSWFSVSVMVMKFSTEKNESILYAVGRFGLHSFDGIKVIINPDGDEREGGRWISRRERSSSRFGV